MKNLQSNNEVFTFFWNKSPFSQFHPCNFVVDDIQFNCAEQWMMFAKANTFDDKDIANLIIKSVSAKQIKALGRKVKNFIKHEWDEVSFDIVYKGNYAKFTQNKKLLTQLMDTKGTTLVEASPYDKIWGIGLSDDDPRALNRQTWLGENRLGEVLTKLRNDLEKQGYAK